LGDFNAKVGKEDIFKPTIWNESLHEISNNNVVRAVNFATSKILIFKNTMFPHATFINIKNGVFWVVTPCGSYKNRRFGGTWRLLHQGDNNW
jgi:hypothetical protein